jgi:hypothetical protein
VRRVGPAGELPVYDVFDRDGGHRQTLRLGFQAVAYFPLRVRHGTLYTLVLDSLDVPYVVRAKLPW